MVARRPAPRQRGMNDGCSVGGRDGMRRQRRREGLGELPDRGMTGKGGSCPAVPVLALHRDYYVVDLSAQTRGLTLINVETARVR